MKPGGPLPLSQQPAICPYPSHSNPAHDSSPHFLNIHCNITLPSKSRSSSGVFPSDLPTKTLLAPLLPLIRSTWPVHSILLDLMTRILFGYEYRSQNSSLRSPLHSPVISPFLEPNILLTILFSNTLSLRSSLNARPSSTPKQNNRQTYNPV